MYSNYVLAKVRAEDGHGGVDTVFLNPEAWDALRGPTNGPDDWGETGTPRYVRKEVPDNAPVQFGMSGDFTVEQTTDYQSYVLAEDGTKISFDGEEVSNT